MSEELVETKLVCFVQSFVLSNQYQKNWWYEIGLFCSEFCLINNIRRTGDSNLVCFVQSSVLNNQYQKNWWWNLCDPQTDGRTDVMSEGSGGLKRYSIKIENNVSGEALGWPRTVHPFKIKLIKQVLRGTQRANCHIGDFFRLQK